MSRDDGDKKAPVSDQVRRDLEPIFGRFTPPKSKEEVSKERKEAQKAKKEKEAKAKEKELPTKLRDPEDPKSKKTYTKDEFVEYYGKKAANKKWAEALKSYQAAK